MSDKTCTESRNICSDPGPQANERSSRTSQKVKDHYNELKKLYHEPSTIRKFIYDLILWSFVVIFDCFFREIRSRGGFRLSRTEPIIFVAAPHANQFVDPIVLMSQVSKACGRRVSCLIAEKSHRRRFIGLVSRSQLAIPVKRAQDNLVAKKGLIRMDPNDELHIIGENTKFTKDCEVKGLVSLPKSLGTGEIGEIVSDTELYLRKPFRYSSEQRIPEGKKLFEEGTFYKAAPKIDQSEVYAQVFEHLAHGHCIGVFSEGGSHDRPDLLPLKAGVAVMALGAMDATPGLSVKIVPVGMNYFHAHKFRSRAVVEFGDPIEIDHDLVAKYADPKSSKDAIRELLDTITKGVKAVTVSCPDYESLAVVQAARRLYSNNLSSQLSIGSIVEMNRRLLQGYLHFKDDTRIQQLKNEILKYNDNLKSLNIPDHLVEKTKDRSKLIVLVEFLGTLFQVLILGILALPGVVLFSPVFIATKYISEKKRREALAGSTVKIKGNDVIATWKILVSMGFAPLLYTAYSIIGISLVQRYYPNMSKTFAFFSFYFLSASITYSALIFGDRGMDLLKSLRALWLLLINKQGFNELKDQRNKLSLEITDAINEYGPKLFKDFDLFEYEKKLEIKKLRKLERKKRHLAKLEDGMSTEEALEELKTQELRQRRVAKKSAKKQIEGDVDNRIKLTTDVPILQNDDMSSGAGLSSSSLSDSDFNSSESEMDCQASGNSKTIGLIRDQIIKENRQREGQTQ